MVTWGGQLYIQEVQRNLLRGDIELSLPYFVVTFCGQHQGRHVTLRKLLLASLPPVSCPALQQLLHRLEVGSSILGSWACVLFSSRRNGLDFTMWGPQQVLFSVQRFLEFHSHGGRC